MLVSSTDIEKIMNGIACETQAQADIRQTLEDVFTFLEATK